MSFLGGPECSTSATPLAQFQKQTSADTSLQRDRLTQLGPQQLTGFRSQHGLPEDVAFQDFQHHGPQLGGDLPSDAFHIEQLRREQEHLNRTSGGGGPAVNGWASEFAQQPFAPQPFAQQNINAGFSPQDFAQFRQSQISPIQRNSPTPTYSQSAYQRPPMYGSNFGAFGMQRPMFQSQFYGQQPQQEQYQGKGKGRVQELTDTDWEKQFEELTTADNEAQLDQLDEQANRDIEEALNGVDR